jgi:hypothetical protein
VARTNLTARNLRFPLSGLNLATLLAKLKDHDQTLDSLQGGGGAAGPISATTVSATSFGPDASHQNAVPSVNGDTFALLAAAQTFITGAKKFAQDILNVANATADGWAKFRTNAASGQTRTVVIPDNDGTLLYDAPGVGGLRVLTSQGHNNTGAVTLTGAKVGDKVIGISNITDHATLLPTTDFEATITVNNQIQQVNASDLSAKTLVFFLGARS